ncbi:mandelate racemase/muconate lactonizing enzyme family protein [Halococcus agarilyticus]|uniref:mandelate racemase/muconate lactonizing enzyme family protein n=1 Tax=Halococcus agarilyticus TaxID=1232219 RepID=UPI0006781E2A|nr:mandelate racemase/muconate lactonizing enzyme family protein [Halococcus agarilyticus]
MPLQSVETFVVRHTDQGHLDLDDEGLPDRPYDLDNFGRFYPTGLEALFVRIETTDGEVAWGEAQAPAGPEAVQSVIDRLLGPFLLTRDSLEPVACHDAMVDAMSVRGHSYGYYADAVAALDVALWDLAGKRYGASVAELLGGRRRERLPAYLSGLRADSLDERVSAAEAAIDEGFEGVKLYLRHDPVTEREAVETIREAVGPNPELFTDLFWAYDLPSATRMGDLLAEVDAAWMEAPLGATERDAHARLAKAVDVPVAVGEPFRTAEQFEDWLSAGAMSVAQPDVPRTGLTGGRRVADLADRAGVPIAPHLGGSFGLGMVATWHLSAAVDNAMIQEHQQRWYDASQDFLDDVTVESGQAVLPDGPGLGVTVDTDALAEYTDDSALVER